jgi:hypothetical protein
MSELRFVCWEDDGAWLGYLRESPEYLTQGETLDDLEEHLLDLQRDLTCGALNEVAPPKS